jgi:hypothetical protein
MTTRRVLRGIELRYVITDHVFRHGPQTIFEILEALEHLGFETNGRASKTVSDALRWEVGRGRLLRLRRGYFGPAFMPPSTEQRIHQRAMQLRAEAAVLTGHTDERFWDKLSAYL